MERNLVIRCDGLPFLYIFLNETVSVDCISFMKRHSIMLDNRTSFAYFIDNFGCKNRDTKCAEYLSDVHRFIQTGLLCWWWDMGCNCDMFSRGKTALGYAYQLLQRFINFTAPSFLFAMKCTNDLCPKRQMNTWWMRK